MFPGCEPETKRTHYFESAQADFIKTSTGFGTAGACVEDVSLFAAKRTGGIQIKASGGKNVNAALQMIEAGATRLRLCCLGVDCPI